MLRIRIGSHMKKPSKREPSNLPNLIVPKAEFEEQLKTQIQEGQRVRNQRIGNWKEFKSAETEESTWIDYTGELLIRSFSTPEEGAKFQKFGKKISYQDPDFNAEVDYFTARMDEAVGHLASLVKRLALIPQQINRETQAGALMEGKDHHPMELKDVKASKDAQMKAITLKERIENSVVYWLLGALLAGFVSGIGVYKGILEIANLEVVSKTEASKLKQENSELNDKVNKLIRGNKPDSSGVDRLVPKEISLNVVRDKPDWVELLVTLYNIEGAVKKNGLGEPNPGIRFGVGAVEYPIQYPTKPFTWYLNAYSAYQITGRGFRLNEDGLIEPLKYQVDESSRSVSFIVPECERGDRLIVVLRVSWGSDVAVDDVRSTFSSSIK